MLCWQGFSKRDVSDNSKGGEKQKRTLHTAVDMLRRMLHKGDEVKQGQ